MREADTKGVFLFQCVSDVAGKGLNIAVIGLVHDSFLEIIGERKIHCFLKKGLS